jgi:thiamine biosynthesis lipoprotein
MNEYRCSVEAMASLFEIILRGHDVQHLEAVGIAVGEEIVRLGEKLSRFEPQSEVSRVNRQPERPVRIDRELFSLLEKCEEGRQLTGGYFDVTGGEGLRLDRDRCTVELLKPQARLDPGGIGKGYALDRGGELIRSFGVASALLQGGTSSILAIGDESWPIAVRDPAQPERVVATLALRNRGFSCSVARHAGETASDLRNPHTGQPIETAEGCFVLAPCATEAEIWSTACLTMGQEVARVMVAQQELELFWIEQ